MSKSQELVRLCFSERAKTFWAAEDVDQVFTGVSEHLDHLKRVLKKNTATDKGWTCFIDVFCDRSEQDVICFPS